MATWLLEVSEGFEAAHHLRSWRGAPEEAHGHTWKVIAKLEAEELDGEGMAFDFVSVRDALRMLTAAVDHRDLNAIPPFDRESPTTERVARWFFEKLALELPRAPLVAVTLFEGPNCSATYRPGRPGPS